MSEFNNRIAAQRDILRDINCFPWKEELFGLSQGAITRWMTINNLNTNSDLICSIQDVAEKLFFLSNKSQEQISEEYSQLSNDVSALAKQIRTTVSELKLEI